MISRSESAALHARLARDRPHELQPAVRTRLEIGFRISAHDYLQALRLRARLAREFIAEVFAEVDVLVVPAIPEPAPALATAKAGSVDDVVTRMGRFSRLTRPFNALGLPALTLPCGFSSDRRPLALQIVGRAFDEATISAARPRLPAGHGVASGGTTALTDTDGGAVERPRLWPVFLSCAAAFVAIVAFSLLAAATVRSLYPDLSDQTVFEGLPGLLAGTVASSAAFVLTALIASGGAVPAALRLLPGRETGRTLLLTVIGMLSLGQALDSLTVLAGLAQHGNMKIIRGALYQVAGPDLVLAVLIVGVLAGTAEEVFFRGYVQTRLVQRLPRGAAVIVTSICFGAFHLDWLHSLLALVLGLYLGWITELTGSALPAVVCHVVNNALFTLVTSRWGGIDGVQTNVALAAAGALVFAGVVAGLRHAPSTPVEGAWFTSVALRVWKRLRR